MKKLIIAEKPSLARTIAKAIESTGEKASNRGGYIETDSYYISYAFGHLFTLFDIDDYEGEKRQWSLDNLPYVPETFKYKIGMDFKTKAVDEGKKRQVSILRTLAEKDDTSGIIHCGDADREGEIIIRVILNEIENQKPVYRMWLPDQTEATILESLNKLEPSANYDNLGDEGYARTYMDWLYGINLTRYATLKSGRLLRVGRVITAIVKAIYDRDMEIRNFVPRELTTLQSNEITDGEIIELKVKKDYEVEDVDRAQAYANELNGLPATVVDIKSEKKIVVAPKLFSQSSLQNFLSKKHGFKPDVTLSLVQSLYEKALVSYPRTPTEYMASAEKGKVKEIIQAIQSRSSMKLVFKDNKRIFDDSKIESHSAITPTTKIASANSFASLAERQCYEAIYRRFCAVFYEEDCIENQSKMVIECGKESFEVKGNIAVQQGWKAVEQTERKDKLLPNLVVGQDVNHIFNLVKDFTKPRAHYTVSTLNNFLKNPFRDELKEIREEDDDDSKDYEAILKGLEIGTEATRSTIIKSAIDSQYIDLTKTQYRIQDEGIYLVESLEKMKIDMSKEKTTFFGQELKKVFLGENALETPIKLVEDELKEILDSSGSINLIVNLGLCPLCKSKIIETSKSFTCIDRGCRFTLWKDSNFVTKFGKVALTPEMVAQLTEHGRVRVEGLTSKAGKTYSAMIEIEVGEQYINLRPNFE